MKRAFFASMVLAAVLVVTSTAAAGESGHPVVGSWQYTLGDGTRAVVQVHGDGTLLVGHDTDDYADGYVHETASAGVWEKTGARTGDMTIIAYTFDAAGDLYIIQRARARGEISLDGGSGVVVMFVDIFLPFQNPIDPDAVPLGGTVGPVSFPIQRMQVMPIPELDE